MDSLLKSTYPTFPYFMGNVLNTEVRVCTRNP